jgi:plastocyanin
MSKTMLKILGISVMILGTILTFTVFSSFAQNPNSTGLQSFHSDADISPIEAVIMINDDDNNTALFQPNITTVRVGGEILIANNATTEHSVTSGTGPDDPMAGKSFDTDIIKPKAFVEYIPENLKPGNYSFYSSTHPEIKGQLVVVSP